VALPSTIGGEIQQRFYLMYEDFRGQEFTRYAIGIAISRGHRADAVRLAAERWGHQSFAAKMLQKAAVAGSFAANSPGWGDSLGSFTQASAEFFELVRERTIIGRLIGLRRVPLFVRTVLQTVGATASWIGEGGLKLASSPDFATDTLSPLKCATIALFTDELARLSDPAAEQTIRDDLVAALAVAIDEAFIDPGNGGTPGLMPASVTNGAPSISTTGTIAADLASLVAAFTGDLTRAVFVAQPETFSGMAGADYPNIGLRGGELLGAPAIASRTAPDDTLVLVDPGRIAFGADLTQVRASGEGTVALDTSPATQLSLWQLNFVGVIVEQLLNWRTFDGAAALLTGMASENAP
jgi:hypothetical protein